MHISKPQINQSPNQARTTVTIFQRKLCTSFPNHVPAQAIQTCSNNSNKIIRMIKNGHHTTRDEFRICVENFSNVVLDDLFSQTQQITLEFFTVFRNLSSNFQSQLSTVWNFERKTENQRVSQARSYLLWSSLTTKEKLCRCASRFLTLVSFAVTIPTVASIYTWELNFQPQSSRLQVTCLRNSTRTRFVPCITSWLYCYPKHF